MQEEEKKLEEITNNNISTTNFKYKGIILNKLGILFFILCFFLYFLLNNKEIIYNNNNNENNNNNNNENKNKVVIVYTSTSFHQEVASSLCCTLSNLNYKVISYITPLADLNNIKIFYGHCVDIWLLINQEDEYEFIEPDLVIFTTYPLRVNGHIDKHAVNLVKNIINKGYSTKFAGMMHHANILQKHPLPLFIPINRFIPIYLSEHTYKSSLLSSSHPNPNSQFIYPVPPRKVLTKHYNYPQSGLFSFKSLSIFASTLTSAPLLSSSLTSSSSSSSKLNYPTIVVQGHFGGPHKWRRDHHTMLSCLRLYQEKEHNNDLKVHFIGSGTLDFTSKERREINIKHYSNLKSSEAFYSEISRGHFLALTSLDDEYYSYRATSSIPTGLMTDLPLILDLKLLKLYPCLRESYYHTLVTKETFCGSLLSVLNLTQVEREYMTNEVKNCRIYYENDAKTKFQNILRNTSFHRTSHYV